LAWALSLAVGWPGPAPWAQLLAWVIASGAAALVLWSARHFRQNHTPILPGQTPHQLITTGPYALSRNPIYLAMALTLVAIALWLGSAAALFAVPQFVILVGRGHIAEEEATIRATFGPAAEAYFSKTGRWI